MIIMIAKVYYKPSNVMQHCAHCKQYVLKGSLVGRTVIGCDKRYPLYAYYHADCLIKELKDNIEEAKGKLFSG